MKQIAAVQPPSNNQVPLPAGACPAKLLCLAQYKFAAAAAAACWLPFVPTQQTLVTAASPATVPCCVAAIISTHDHVRPRPQAAQLQICPTSAHQCSLAPQKLVEQRRLAHVWPPNDSDLLAAHSMQTNEFADTGARVPGCGHASWLLCDCSLSVAWHCHPAPLQVQHTLGSSRSSWRRPLEESSLPSAQQLLMLLLLPLAHGPWASRPAAAACGSPLLLAPPAAEPAACRLRALMRHTTWRRLLSIGGRSRHGQPCGARPNAGVITAQLRFTLQPLVARRPGSRALAFSRGDL